MTGFCLLCTDAVRSGYGSGVCRSAAVRALLEGVAVHTFLDGRVSLVRPDVNCVQCAEVLPAQIVAALLHRAVNVRVLLLIHLPDFLSVQRLYGRAIGRIREIPRVRTI